MEKIVRTFTEVARHFNLTERTIYDWKRFGMPVREDGSFDLMAITRWRENRNQRKPANRDKDSEYWQKEYRKNKAKLAELDLKVKQGNFVAKADVISALKEIQSYVKKHLLLIPRIAPERMIGLDVQGQAVLLGEMIETILIGMTEGQSAKKIEGILRNGPK